MSYPAQIIIILLLWCAGLGHCRAQAGPGVLDVRAAIGDIKLGGDWEFYWQQHITTNKEGAILPDAYTRLVGQWEDIKTTGAPLPNTGFATYRLKVLLPARLKNNAALLIPPAYSAWKLWVNGILVAGDGVAGIDKAGTKPHWSTQLVRLQPGADTVELVLQVSNFTHQKSGWTRFIELGAFNSLRQTYDRYAMGDFIVAGCLIMGALFFLCLYLFNRKEKSILYFALFCLSYSYRSFGTEFYALHNAYAGLNYFVTLRIEYLTLPVSVILYACYMRHLFPAENKKWGPPFFIACSAVYALIILFAPALVFTDVLKYFLFVIVLSFPYCVYVFTQAHRRNRPGARYGVWSFMFLALLVTHAIGDYFDLLPPLRLLDLLAYLAFILLQSLVLIYRSAYYYRLAKVEAERGLAAKTEFLSTMSHEIRTPLNGVIGITQLLQRDGHNLSQQQKEYIETLAFSSGNLLAIVNDILDYEKVDARKMHIEHIPMQPGVIAAKVVAAFRQVASGKGVDLRLVTDAALPEWVLGDPTRTYQVLSNLVSNAVKFTSIGFVEIRLQPETPPAAQSASIRFEISDSGIGIAPQQLQKIFEPFTQADSSTSRSFGGSGLGLAICKNILSMQGVELKVESQPGKGSRFSFKQTFDLAHGPAVVTSKQPASGMQPRRAGGHQILLVEDNRINAMVAVKFLEKWGYRADVAQSGREALRMFDAEKHDLILMDLQMPEMDGFEATRAIRATNSRVPIIALTANVAEDVAQRVADCGMNNMVSKPFKQEQLQAILEQYLS